MPRQFCPSVCLSVTRIICVKTAEHVVEILSLSDRPVILVFVIKGCYENLTAYKYKRVAMFDQYAAIYLGNGNRQAHIYYGRRI